jgi:predicted RNA binding protein YcfA (HicA-like mRNA interferase family)
LINIKNSTAPKSYEFDLVLPEGSKLINAKDYTGSESDKEVLVVDKNNNITTIFLPAWAKDANGEEVNTYYTIDGNKLIQVVEFDENSVFPIIADPLPLILAGAGGAALIALGQAAGYTLAAIATIVLAIGVAEAMDKFIAEASANSKPTGNKVKDVKKRLKKEGFKKTGQTGSHEKWKKDDKTVTVPNHGDNYEIPIGTLRNIWKQAGWI